MTKFQILKAIKKSKIKFPIFALEDTERAIYEIGKDYRHGELGFDIVGRCDLQGNDGWLQCSFYSKAIGATIIYNDDYNANYDTADELATALIHTGIEIKNLEAKLADKNTKKHYCPACGK